MRASGVAAFCFCSDDQFDMQEVGSAVNAPIPYPPKLVNLVTICILLLPVW